MRVYPKVPRYDHPTVSEGLYSADDLTLLEKLDGSNFRFMLYEERFRNEYSDRVTAQEPADGDVVFGAKKSIRGPISQPLERIDGSFRRAVKHLRTRLDTTEVRAAQDSLGPLVFYAENMIPHTLDYNYASNPPPALLGFDIYVARDGPETVSGNPYEQDFTGFLPIQQAWSLFDDVNLQTVPRLKTPSVFNPDDYEVPPSSYADGRAEGVVLRSDEQQARAKLVTEQFQELNRRRWGKNETEANSEAELAAIRLCSDARIRKAIHGLVREEDASPEDEQFVETVSKVVYADIWAEEWQLIKTFDITLDTAVLYEYIQQRAEGVVERVTKTAAVSDVSVTDVWATDGSSRRMRMKPATEEQKADLTDVADQFLSEAFLDTVIEDSLGRDAQPSDIDTLYDELYDSLWKKHWNDIAQMNVSFVPSTLRNEAATFTADVITNRA